jgi:hypothetical protein
LLALVCPERIAARQAEGAAVLSGRVQDEEGRPVPGADVSLEHTALAAVTDERGRFRLEPVPAGTRVIVVERIGYRTRTDSLAVPDGVAMELELTVSVDAVPVEGIVVSVRSLLLESRGFYDRQRQGFRGFFMDRPAIEKRDPLYVADLFRTIAGVEVVNGSRLIMSQSVNFSDGGRGCEPSLWLDGVRSGLRNYDYIKPDHVEGLEVYTGGGAPGKYNDLCGTVVIWTRVVMRRRPPEMP